MTTFWNQIEKQNKLQNLLDSYGVKFQSSPLSIESEMAYTKSNGGGVPAIILSYDVDLNDVMEDEKITGLTITSSYLYSGFKKPSYPITIVNFD